MAMYMNTIVNLSDLDITSEMSINLLLTYHTKQCHGQNKHQTFSYYNLISNTIFKSSFDLDFFSNWDTFSDSLLDSISDWNSDSISDWNLNSDSDSVMILPMSLRFYFWFRFKCWFITFESVHFLGFRFWNS